MTVKISKIILKNRIPLLIIVGILTVFMAYQGKNISLSYENTSILSEKDSAMIGYKQFKQQFGEDGNVMVIGIKHPGIFQIDQFNAWYDLGNRIKQVDGVKEVLSIAQSINLLKNEEAHQFDLVQLVRQRPASQAEVDSLKKQILSLKFYEGLIYNPVTHATLMTITLDKSKLNNISRIKIVEDITRAAEDYKLENKVELHISGMPYIRTITMQKVKSELFLFVILSIAVAAVILFLFFRSFKVVFSSLLIVGVSIIWVMGTIVLFGFKITLLTGVIPSLIVIIAIENCIYVLNKYHWEYRGHGDKMKALAIVVQRIGFASLMTNAATALGFAAFILIPNQVLREFGIITSVNIMIEYLICIILLPIIFSFIPPPTQKHVKHLDNRFFRKIIDNIINLISYRRTVIYVTAGVLLVIGMFGISRMKTSGKVVDDFQHDDPLLIDLKFFEQNFGGVMPFEIAIDTKKKNGVLERGTIEKIDQLQEEINSHPEFSKPLSIAQILKFSRQSYYRGDSSKFSIPSQMERNFILSYLPKSNPGKNKNNLLNAFIDSTRQITRVSFQMTDIGTKHMDSLMADIQPSVDSIFDKSKFDVKVTGNSVIYARGTNFLIRNLYESVAIAIVSISLLMALLFSSFKMILVSMIPNIIPLLITAAIMGFTGVPIKPSTIIVFSIALGISIDNAIQYLSRYRHELKVTGGAIKDSAINALHEAGFSMIYTSIVLVLGFSVFIVSGFGGTQALGILISTSLFIAMFFNIMVLPSLLLSLDKRLASKRFIAPIIEIYDEGDILNGDEEDENPDKKK